MEGEKATTVGVRITDDGRMAATVLPCLKCPRCGAVNNEWDMALWGGDDPMAMKMRVIDGKPCLCVMANWHCVCGYVVHYDLAGFTWWGQMGEGGAREDLKLPDFMG